MPYHALTLRWPPELVQRIDELRGDVPRSTWLQRAALERLAALTDPGNTAAPAQVWPEQAPNGHPPKEHQ